MKGSQVCGSGSSSVFASLINNRIWDKMKASYDREIIS